MEICALPVPVTVPVHGKAHCHLMGIMEISAWPVPGHETVYDTQHTIPITVMRTL